MKSPRAKSAGQTSVAQDAKRYAGASVTRKLVCIGDELRILFSRRLHHCRSVALPSSTWVSQLQIGRNSVEMKWKVLSTLWKSGLLWAAQPEVPASTAFLLLLKQSWAWEVTGYSGACCPSARQAQQSSRHPAPQGGQAEPSQPHTCWKSGWEMRLCLHSPFPCSKLGCCWPC